VTGIQITQYSWEQALKLMSEGWAVRRRSWHINTYVGLTNSPNMPTTVVKFQNHGLESAQVDNFFVRSFKGAKLKPWHPTASDFNASDWTILLFKGVTS
jgi:hypothetical protein